MIGRYAIWVGIPRLAARWQAARALARGAVTFLAIGAAGPAFAVPAQPDGREVVQPDGTRFTLRLRGDEFFSWKETPEGYPVVRDAADGFWKYALPAADKAEFRAIRGARVGSSDPVRLGARRRALPGAALLKAPLDKLCE